MENVNTIILFLGGIGLLLVIVVLIYTTRKKGDKSLEDAVCKMFFDQHHFLFTHKKDLFEYEKTKEILLAQKIRFFQEPITITNQEKYLQRAKNDMTYVLGLIQQ